MVKSSYLGSVTSSPTKQLSTAFNAEKKQIQWGGEVKQEEREEGGQ